jgi:uncharacterized membrane protein YjgN (DUF898 family)
VTSTSDSNQRIEPNFGPDASADINPSANPDGPSSYTPNFNPSGKPSATPTTFIDPIPFIFRGRGSEYFRIWIVNLLLTLLTLGIYSAWAKVRRNRYLYDNTSVAGSSFDYHGNPIAILKGRIIAIVFIAMYHLAPRISVWAAVLVAVLIVAASPWLIWKSLQFKLYNSSYRGIRFGLQGSLKAAYQVYLLLPILAVLTLDLLWPFAHQRMKRFQHNASRFGDSSFSFHATVGSFYKIYLLCGAIGFAGMMTSVIFIVMQSIGGHGAATAAGKIMTITYISLFVVYGLMLIIYPIYQALMQNLVWNNTRLGAHEFRSTMQWSRAMWIVLSNLFLVAVTLGLFMPFATIRWQRYRIEAMSLLPASDLSEFVAGSEPTGSATGEGMTDLLDFGLSL